MSPSEAKLLADPESIERNSQIEREFLESGLLVTGDEEPSGSAITKLNTLRAEAEDLLRYVSL